MYDNLEEALRHKRFNPTPRSYPKVKLQEQYAVEPWEKVSIEVEKNLMDMNKNTMELLMKDISRPAMTVYNAPSSRP